MSTPTHADPDLGARMSPARQAPIDLSAADFRALGHELVDAVAAMLEGLPERPVAPDADPAAIRKLIPSGGVPEQGTDPAALLRETTALLAGHSTFNGHPRFFGYITAAAAPIGVLADMLASAVNPNVGAWSLSPVATEIERQSVRWVAEMIGFPADAGGIFVSGGNVANLVCFLAARTAIAPWDVKAEGVQPDASRRLVLYTSEETHTWVQKAADVCGLGTAAIRWIATDSRGRMRVDALRTAIARDRDSGVVPFLVIGTAGATGTGAIDPLAELGAVARESGLWFHVDGAYGAPAAALPEAPQDLRALSSADSVAVDPHKWFYAPLEAGCALVRDPEALHRTFRQAQPPSYYHFAGDDADPPINYYEWGLQNSRGFRALKVWLALRQVGREGYVRMIRDDIALTRVLFDAAAAHPELEAVTCELSIATFAYAPTDLRARASAGVANYLNELNAAVLERTQHDGRVYLSNAVVDGRFLLRACIVNFRTGHADVLAVPEIVATAGRALDRRMRPVGLR